MLAFKNIIEFKSTVNSVIDESPRLDSLETRMDSLEKRMDSLEDKFRQLNVKFDTIFDKMYRFLDDMSHLFHRKKDLDGCLIASQSQKKNLDSVTLVVKTTSPTAKFI